LKLLKRYFSTGMRLQVYVQLIVFLHTGGARRVCRNSGTKFLEMQAYAVEGDGAPAVGTFNSRQSFS
jgi:hypothetical protein